MVARFLWLSVAGVALLTLCVEARPQLVAIPPPEMPSGTGTIAGVVLDPFGQPAVGSAVWIKWHSDPSTLISDHNYQPRKVATDDRGRFAFSDVPQHAVELMASIPGSAEVIYGQARPGLPGTPIRLHPREHLQVVLRVSRGSNMTGRVIHPDGAPGKAFTVLAFRIRQDGDESILGDVSETVSDEHGEYRLTGLTPGRYSLAADPPRPGQSLFDRPPLVQIGLGQFGYEARAYPANTTDLCFETPFTLEPGRDQEGIDLLAHIEPVTTVTGVVRDSEGRVVPGARVWLSSDSSCIGNRGWVEAGPDGTFEIIRVESGNYELNAFRKAAQTGWGRTSVAIDGRAAQRPIVISVQQGGSISGHVELGAGMIPPPPGQFPLYLGAARGIEVNDVLGVDRVIATPKFEYPSVPVGQYVITVDSLPAGWFIRSEMVDGRDALDFPFELGPSQRREVVITLSNTTTALSGTVTDSRGAPSLNHTVVVFAADDRLWTWRWRRILADRPDTHGEFHFSWPQCAQHGCRRPYSDVRIPECDDVLASG